MTVAAWVYILLCSDGSYYTGSHRGPDVAKRVAEHQDGFGGDYTRRRRPVQLVWSQEFRWIIDAIAFERQAKGWSRAKKEALIRGEWDMLKERARRRGGEPRPSRPAMRAPQDED